LIDLKTDLLLDPLRKELRFQAIERALDATIADPASRTPDLDGSLGTDVFAQRVAQAM